MEATVDERRELLAQDLDFAGLEQAITAQMNALGAELVKQVVEPLLVDEDYVERLKGLGGQRGLKFKEYRVVRVRLGTGQWIAVKTAYFIKAHPKSGKRRAKRQRRGGRGAYLGLEALGFLGHYSLSLVSEVVEMAVLCPSLAVAQTVLARRGLELNVKTVRRLCGELGHHGLALRGVGANCCQGLSVGLSSCRWASKRRCTEVCLPAEWVGRGGGWRGWGGAFSHRNVHTAASKYATRWRRVLLSGRGSNNRATTGGTTSSLTAINCRWTSSNTNSSEIVGIGRAWATAT